MSAYEDFVAFVDSGSKVPYFQKDATYLNKPLHITTQFEYDFKIYYKSYNRYFVGIHCKKLVREIRASDFKMMSRFYSERYKESLVSRLQLVFDL